MASERFVARCQHCGTGYTVRSWYWLESLGIERYGEGGISALEVRQCAVPGCCQTLTRRSELTLAMECARGEASNDVR